MLLRLVSLVGLVSMLGLAWFASESRRNVPWRILIWGIGLQFAIGLLLLPTPLQTSVFSPIMRGLVWAVSFGKVKLESTPDELFFVGMKKAVDVLTSSTLEGSRFVFGRLAEDLDIGAIVAFQVLPVIILVSAISAILYHLHVIQAVVRAMAYLMRRTLKTSGAETFGAGLLVFLGIESMTAIRAYLRDMTRSELCTIMTTFMATIAGSVMVVYANLGAEPGHLLTASLMSAPAAILIAKLMVPETGWPRTSGSGCIELAVESHNAVDAAARGTGEGLYLALNVGAMLITFIGIVHLINGGLRVLSGPVMGLMYTPFAEEYGLPEVKELTLKGLFAVVFVPFAFLLGVPLGDVPEVARLLGTKTALNEFLAYIDLQTVRGAISPRSNIIATYALCGFANPGSLGIIIAGLTGLVPERRKEIVELGLKSFIGGTLACFTTACIAGILV